jgi:NTE family protein
MNRGSAPRPAARAARHILLAAALVASAAPAADAPSDQPCTGTALVLSGGGARGAAHIGVIKVLEERRVPVACVIGTSMGSLVGGLYAAGMSSATLEKQLTDIDWDAALGDEPDRTKVAFRTKQDDAFGLFPFEFGVGADGVGTTRGMAAGNHVEFVIRKLTLHAATIEDFDRLRLPFRAIASDLATGEMVVLEKGDLALAMRASMSIPGAFKPVEIDGRTLVDGLVARNFPIDVAQSLGATRVIAIDVGTPPSRDVKDLGIAGVIAQMVALLTDQNVVAQRTLLKEQDLLITPELDGISSADFTQLHAAKAAGEAAARAALAHIDRFAVDEAEFKQYLERQRSRQRAMPTLGKVRVEVQKRDGSVVDAPHLTRRIDTEPGAKLDLVTLEEDLTRVLQAGEFESINYTLDRAAGGSRDLTIRAQEKSWGPGYLRFGLGMESNLEGSTDFRFLLSYRRPNLTEYGGELKLNAMLGSPMMLAAEYFHPLERSQFLFVAPYAGGERVVEERETPVGDEVLRIGNSRAGLDLGVLLRNWGELRLGAYSGRASVDSETASAIPSGNSDLGAWRLRATLDQLDNLYFPTAGNFSRLELTRSTRDLGADDEYQKAELRSTSAFTHGRNTFVTQLRYGTAFGGTVPLYDDFDAGGFMNLSGYARESLHGDELLIASFGDYWRWGEFGNLGRSYFGAMLEAGNTWQAPQRVDLGDLRSSLLLFVGVDNKLTPVYFGVAFNDEGRTQGYLYIGRPF